MGKKVISGVYKIASKKTGAFYYGSSANLRKRKVRHLADLKSGKYGEHALQRLYDKYGPDDLTFTVVKVTDVRDSAYAAEDRLVDRARDDKKCLNHGLSFRVAFPVKPSPRQSTSVTMARHVHKMYAQEKDDWAGSRAPVNLDKKWVNKVHFGDCRETLRKMAKSGVRVQTCVTSPPYFGLRDYGRDGQIGLEETPQEFIAKLVEVFRCVRDVMTDDGTLWVNIGDSYASKGSQGAQSGIAGRQRAHARSNRSGVGDGVKEKDLIGIPWMLAFALRADGWYLRQDIIWHKPNPMPESVTDRCTKAHEYIFLLSKSPKYFFDYEAVKEKAVSTSPAGNKRHKYADAYAAGSSEEHRTKAGLLALAGVSWETRNRRSVWTIATKPYKGAHFATYPTALIEPCILAGSREGDIVLDPFMGSGTTAAHSKTLGRNYVGCELNTDYKSLQDQRIAEASLPPKKKTKLFK